MTWFKLNKVKTHEILKDLHETSNLVISLIHLLPYGSSLNNNQKETIYHVVKLKVPLKVPLKVKVKVKVRTWSGHGQARSGQTLTPTLTQMWDLSYTLKLVSTTTHHHHSPPPPSLNECLVNFVTLCDTL